MSFITSIHGREVLDSRGNPTVEVEVSLADGAFGRAIVLPGHPPVCMKHGKNGMAINLVIWVKVYWVRLRPLMKHSLKS